jgi:PAS domain S-box-containing protein
MATPRTPSATNEELLTVIARLRSRIEELELSSGALKKAEDAQRENEQRLRFHFENSPLAVVEWDASFIVTQWSSEAERIFGWKREETLGKRIDALNMIHPADISIVNRTMERLTGGKERMVVSSNRNLTKSGAVIECTWHNSVLLDHDGRMASVMSLVQDITERTRAEAALRESEERFKAIAETTPVGIGVVSVPDGTFLYVNTAYETKYGYAKGELVSKGTPDIYWDAADRDRILRVLKERGRVADYEVRLKRKDGTFFWGMASVQPISYGGKPALLGSFVDITERKKVENELKQHAEELERFNRAMMHRELRMIELKRQMNELCIRAGEAPRFALGFDKPNA